METFRTEGEISAYDLHGFFGQYFEISNESRSLESLLSLAKDYGFDLPGGDFERPHKASEVYGALPKIKFFENHSSGYHSNPNIIDSDWFLPEFKWFLKTGWGLKSSLQEYVMPFPYQNYVFNRSYLTGSENKNALFGKDDATSLNAQETAWQNEGFRYRIVPCRMHHSGIDFEQETNIETSTPGGITWTDTAFKLNEPWIKYSVKSYHTDDQRFGGGAGLAYPKEFYKHQSPARKCSGLIYHMNDQNAYGYFVGINDNISAATFASYPWNTQYWAAQRGVRSWGTFSSTYFHSSQSIAHGAYKSHSWSTNLLKQNLLNFSRVNMVIERVFSQPIGASIDDQGAIFRDNVDSYFCTKNGPIISSMLRLKSNPNYLHVGSPLALHDSTNTSTGIYLNYKLFMQNHEGVECYAPSIYFMDLIYTPYKHWKLYDETLWQPYGGTNPHNSWVYGGISNDLIKGTDRQIADACSARVSIDASRNQSSNIPVIWGLLSSWKDIQNVWWDRLNHNAYAYSWENWVDMHEIFPRYSVSHGALMSSTDTPSSSTWQRPPGLEGLLGDDYRNEESNAYDLHKHVKNIKLEGGKIVGDWDSLKLTLIDPGQKNKNITDNQNSILIDKGIEIFNEGDTIDDWGAVQHQTFLRRISKNNLEVPIYIRAGDHAKGYLEVCADSTVKYFIETTNDEQGGQVFTLKSRPSNLAPSWTDPNGYNIEYSSNVFDLDESEYYGWGKDKRATALGLFGDSSNSSSGKFYTNIDVVPNQDIFLSFSYKSSFDVDFYINNEVVCTAPSSESKKCYAFSFKSSSSSLKISFFVKGTRSDSSLYDMVIYHLKVLQEGDFIQSGPKEAIIDKWKELHFKNQDYFYNDTLASSKKISFINPHTKTDLYSLGVDGVRINENHDVSSEYTKTFSALVADRNSKKYIFLDQVSFRSPKVGFSDIEKSQIDTEYTNAWADPSDQNIPQKISNSGEIVQSDFRTLYKNNDEEIKNTPTFNCEIMLSKYDESSGELQLFDGDIIFPDIDLNLVIWLEVIEHAGGESFLFGNEGRDASINLRMQAVSNSTKQYGTVYDIGDFKKEQFETDPKYPNLYVLQYGWSEFKKIVVDSQNFEAESILISCYLKVGSDSQVDPPGTLLGFTQNQILLPKDNGRIISGVNKPVINISSQVSGPSMTENLALDSEVFSWRNNQPLIKYSVMEGLNVINGDFSESFARHDDQAIPNNSCFITIDDFISEDTGVSFNDISTPDDNSWDKYFKHGKKLYNNSWVMIDHYREMGTEEEFAEDLFTTRIRGGTNATGYEYSKLGDLDCHLTKNALSFDSLWKWNIFSTAMFYKQNARVFFNNFNPKSWDLETEPSKIYGPIYQKLQYVPYLRHDPNVLKGSPNKLYGLCALDSSGMNHLRLDNTGDPTWRETLSEDYIPQNFPRKSKYNNSISECIANERAGATDKFKIRLHFLCDMEIEDRMQCHKAATYLESMILNDLEVDVFIYPDPSSYEGSSLVRSGPSSFIDGDRGVLAKKIIIYIDFADLYPFPGSGSDGLREVSKYSSPVQGATKLCFVFLQQLIKGFGVGTLWGTNYENFYPSFIDNQLSIENNFSGAFYSGQSALDKVEDAMGINGYIKKIKAYNTTENKIVDIDRDEGESWNDCLNSQDWFSGTILTEKIPIQEFGVETLYEALLNQDKTAQDNIATYARRYLEPIGGQTKTIVTYPDISRSYIDMNAPETMHISKLTLAFFYDLGWDVNWDLAYEHTYAIAYNSIDYLLDQWYNHLTLEEKLAYGSGDNAIQTYLMQNSQRMYE